MQFEFGTDDNDRSARIIDTFAKQILTKTSAFAFEHVAQRFQRTISRAGNSAAVTAVVEQRIDRFLQHSFFVSNDDVLRFELEQILETIVPVDDAAIKIVEVRCRETSTFERNQ